MQQVLPIEYTAPSAPEPEVKGYIVFDGRAPDGFGRRGFTLFMNWKRPTGHLAAQCFHADPANYPGYVELDEPPVAGEHRWEPAR